MEETNVGINLNTRHALTVSFSQAKAMFAAPTGFADEQPVQPRPKALGSAVSS